MQVALEPAKLRWVYWHMAQDITAQLGAAKNRIEMLKVLDSRVVVVVAHDQLFNSIQSSQSGERALAKQHIAKVPHGIFLAYRVIPSAHKFVVVLFNRRKWAARILKVNNLLVPEVGI